MHPIPLIILGGSDRQAYQIPVYQESKGSEETDLHPLRGYKGLALTVQGRPLVQVIIERMAATGAFDPIWVVGPRKLYAEILPDTRIVDADGSFGENLRTVVETARAELGTDYLAFATCDILPASDQLAVAVADLEHHMPVDFWMPLIPIPEQGLGSSDWKPRYRMRPPGATEATRTLPGHLVIGATNAIRLDFVYHLFDLLYRTRNSSITRRLFLIARGMLWKLLREDMQAIFSGRVPYALSTVVVEGLRFSLLLRAGSASTENLEERIRNVCMSRSHRRHYPERRGRIAILDVLSLARDIDTEEEARELTDSPETSGIKS